MILIVFIIIDVYYKLHCIEFNAVWTGLPTHTHACTHLPRQHLQLNNLLQLMYSDWIAMVRTH